MISGFLCFKIFHFFLQRKKNRQKKRIIYSNEILPLQNKPAGAGAMTKPPPVVQASLMGAGSGPGGSISD